LAEKQTMLEELRLPKIKGVMMRSKAKYYEAGEKPSKYFCNLEKRNYVAKTIKRLVVNDTEVYDQTEIISEQKLYYQNLYSCKQVDDVNKTVFCNMFLKEEHIQRLTDTQSKQGEGCIQLSEIKQVLKGMGNGKSPGSDGFTGEFYKFFFPDLGHFLLRSLNHAFSSGELSITQKQGVITCLPKGDKPREYLKNWRPISLLNVDYKILSGVLARRMKGVLSTIIGETQKGFLRNRFISENTRLVYDVIDYLKRSDKNGVLLLIDFEKAFDSLDWDFISRVLEAYNFGIDFRKWFRVLYNDAKSTVINNGHFSEFFNIGRGCRQGDPLSPYLFILCVEPLAAVLKSDDKIKGITIGKYCYKIGQYADDTFSFQDGSISSMNRTFELLEMFYMCSGLKANIDKTQAVWLGPKCEKWVELRNRVRLKWVEQFCLLGIHYDVNADNMIHVNYEKRIQEIESVFKMYQHRSLSLIGRVTVIKTLAIPKLIHVLQTLPSPSVDTINKLKTCIRHFLWNGKRAKISLEQLGKTIENGGLALTNIDTLCKSIKVSWIRRLISTDGGWQRLFQDTICNEKVLIWQLDNKSLCEMSERTRNMFWKEVIQSWKEFVCQYEKADRSVISYPIWNTYFLKNRNLLTMKNKLIECGITCIQDLLNEDRDFLRVSEFNKKYKVCLNFMDYKSLIHSIPVDWRHKIFLQAEEINLVTCQSLDFVRQNYKCNKAVYMILNESCIQSVKNNRDKWSEILVEDISKTEWENIMCIPWQSTVETKLRSFQYNIISRTLITNKKLYQWKLVDSDLCQFCKVKEETIEHLMYGCDKVAKLWQAIFAKLEQYMNVFHVVSNPRAVICGTNNTNNYKLVNHILLIVKKYIYNSRCMNNVLSINGAILMIKKCYVIEYQLACQSNNPGLWGKFTDKWKPLMENEHALFKVDEQI